MAEKTKSVGFEAVRAYIREAILAEPGADMAMAERLALRFSQDLDHLVKLAGTGPSPDTAPDFDPFVFGAVVTLQRDGRETLKRRLEKIESVEHLRHMAEAQHLAADLNLNDAASLRRAIIAGAEMRLANRCAAAAA